MAHLIIFCDACVLYPASIRDLLMMCALNDLVQLKWSERVLNEWIDNLIRNRPDLSRKQLEKTKNDMNSALLDSMVENYESIEKKLALPDKNDTHVLAAAMASKSQFIVTADLKDFPSEYLSKFKINACHPDELFLKLGQMNKERFLGAVKECYQKLRRPPKTIEQYITTLSEKCRLAKTAIFISEHKSFLM